MEIEINGKKYEIKEMGYLDGIDVEETKTKEGLRAGIEKMIKCSTNLSEEEIRALSMKDGLELQKAINEFNGLGFQKPTKE